MTPTVTAVRIHDDDATREIIGSALKIVAELEIDGDLRVPAFEKACDLLGLRVTLAAEQQSIPLPFELRRALDKH